MRLIDYIKPLSKDALDELADRCSTSSGQLKQVAGGHRRCGENLAINIERETGAAVTCEELRPDVDWAYLRNSPKPKRRAGGM